DLIQSGGGVFPTKPVLAGLDVASIELLGVRTWRRGNFAPYVGFGIGVTNLDPDLDDPAVRDTNRAALSLAAGARFYAVRWAGSRCRGPGARRGQPPSRERRPRDETRPRGQSSPCRGRRVRRKAEARDPTPPRPRSPSCGKSA